MTLRSWTAYATVLQVVDGDTFHSTLDIGWGVLLKPRRLPHPGLGTVRVLFPDGRPYDAPEISTELGKAAKSFISILVPVGSELEVRSFRLDDFGRTLGAVILPGGQDWASAMSNAGYVKQAS